MLSTQGMGFRGMVRIPLVIIFSLCGGPGGTLKPRFLRTPAEYRENIQFTSNRWFLMF